MFMRTCPRGARLALRSALPSTAISFHASTGTNRERAGYRRPDAGRRGAAARSKRSPWQNRRRPDARWCRRSHWRRRTPGPSWWLRLRDWRPGTQRADRGSGTLRTAMDTAIAQVAARMARLVDPGNVGSMLAQAQATGPPLDDGLPNDADATGGRADRRPPTLPSAAGVRAACDSDGPRGRSTSCSLAYAAATPCENGLVGRSWRTPSTRMSTCSL